MNILLSEDHFPSSTSRHLSLLLSFILLVLLVVPWASCIKPPDPMYPPPEAGGLGYVGAPHGPSIVRDRPMMHDGKNMQRAEYFEMIHRSAPGVSWRDFEYDNCARAMERKQTARRNPSPDPGTWRELGSRNLAGRVHTAALSSDGQTLYTGADRGGIWKADLNGNGWTPVGDTTYGGAHELGIIPAPGGGPDILIRLWTDWWSLFWENPTSFTLVHRSEDGGGTWTLPEGLGRLTCAKRLIVMDDVGHTVFLLAKKKQTWHILVSTDCGKTFESRRTLATCGDIWTSRLGGGPLYLFDARWTFKTDDGGLTWSGVGDLIPINSKEQVLVGSTGSDPHFYAAMEYNGHWELWRSEPGAVNWEKQCNLGSRFLWWKSLEASCRENQLMAYGGTEFFYSRVGGGYPWDRICYSFDYYTDPVNNLHPDIPGICALPHPAAPLGEVWYISTDGGLYDSYDQLETARNLCLERLGIGQYYSVLTSRRNPNLVIAGSQDQGYQRAEITGEPPPAPGPWVDFTQMVSGDYGRSTSTNGSHDLVYSIYPHFEGIAKGFLIVHIGEEDPGLVMPNLTNGLYYPDDETHAWMPQILADPLDAEAFYFCASKLYRYYRVGLKRWDHVQHSAHDFGPGFLSAIAFSPLNAQKAWAVTSDGRMFHSNDRAVTWTESQDTGPGFSTYFGMTLLPSSIDENVCWVGGSGYGNASVFRTTDGGVTWVPEDDDLPPTLVYCMTEAPDQSGKIFCGTEMGAWVYNPDTRRWSDILGADAPITTYWDCETVPSQNLIRFATYARGIWDYHLNTPGYFPYGELLGGVHLLGLGNAAKPLIGKPSTFEITGCRPEAHGLLVCSSSKAEIPMLGGTLLVDISAAWIFPFTASVEGEGEASIEIPHDPLLVGSEFFIQAGAEDETTCCGWALSHGLRGIIGQ